ncbi:phage tail protein [Lacinutrix sp. WUR7]|uniref:phage tail protein n=1 Tax=Lacinutrix sp. WUR7 TaxID=2653681 RepID=UPI00193EB9F6|nr:tail fiber protein [Lacinutrix sp. WUR7]QRM88374.1 phage tail protein [Lacinutrix sp. WUR7]
MDPFIAQIILFGGTFAPRGWAYCDGQLLPISQYNALFSLLGTTYGGDGRTTFALPDLRGRVPVHPGSGPGQPTIKLGQKGGEAAVILNANQMPTHNHTAVTNAVSPIPRGGATVTNPANAYNAEGGVFATGANAQMAADATVIGQSGGNLPHNNMQPFTALSYIIALQGVFPSRN